MARGFGGFAIAKTRILTDFYSHFTNIHNIVLPRNEESPRQNSTKLEYTLQSYLRGFLVPLNDTLNVKS